MTELALAALLFVGTHLGIAGTRLRALIVARTGEAGYLVAYVVISLVTISWLADAWKAAPYVETWGQVYSVQPLALAGMALAFLLVVIGLTTPSPTLVGAEGLLAGPSPVRGILRITRHPFLSGVALWSVIHLVVNGDQASLILFGSMAVLAIAGAWSIDGKRAEKMGARWETFCEQTSILPFAAILQGRNRLVFAEIGWWRIGLAVAIFFAVLHFHAGLFGVSPVSAISLG